MSNAVLDLDHPRSWHDDIRGAVYDDITWAALSADFHGEGHLFQQLHNTPEHVSDPMIRALRDRCEELIRARYSGFAAYHACRTVDPNAYRMLGILTSSRGRLTSVARYIFRGLSGLESAIVECDGYFELYGDTVSLYGTAYFAPNCYLAGSHYLAMLARELGPEANQRLESESAKGRSYFVKCTLPIEWLDDLKLVDVPSLRLFSTSVIRKLIVMRATNVDAYVDVPFALVVRCPISPEKVCSITEAAMD